MGWGRCVISAGLALTEADINGDLARRQRGYGRGARQSIEQDRAEILGGVRHGLTLGSPVSIVIHNTEWPKWQEEMSPAAGATEKPLHQPRPGHAPLPELGSYPGPVLLYVGRVAKEKNLPQFLDAQVPGHKVVVGDGPDLESLRDLVKWLAGDRVAQGAALLALCASLIAGATLFFPWHTFDRITQNPNVLGGRATIRGLRISVAHVVNLLANDMTPAQIVTDLPDLANETDCCCLAVRMASRKEASTLVWPAPIAARNTARSR